MGIAEPAEDKIEHVDTSCYFLHKEAFELLTLWTQMHKSLGPIGDRIFFSAIKHKRFRTVSTKLRSVAFRSQYAYHYQLAKLNIPKGSKTSNEFLGAYTFLKSVLGVTDCQRNIGFWPLPYLSKK
jgi:hypothetical protein